MFRTSHSLNFGECPTPIQEAVEFLRPKDSPWYFARFGGAGDGSYLLPDSMGDISACFSPGVRNSKAFEDELLEKAGVRSHLMDFTSDPEHFSTRLRDGLQTFEKKWLAPSSGKDELSLADWIARYEPDSASDFILQIDIEGGEWPIFASVSADTIRRFKVIVVELHKLDGLMTNFEAFSSIAADAFSLLREHFTVIHAHPNNCCGVSQDVYGSGIKVPRTLEVTMVRSDYLEENLESFPVKSPTLPHPLDIKRNVPGTPPIFLGRGWRDHPMSVGTTLRVILQRLEYDVFWNWKRLIPGGVYRRLKQLARDVLNVKR